ncbi:putative ribonuclease H-like domain-containing protein [Tanacetum coccineum]
MYFWPSAPIIEESESDSDDDYVFRPKPDQTKPKFDKINFVKYDKNVKSVKKENTHRQKECPRKSQSTMDNRRNWNGMLTQKLRNGFEFIKKACFVCESFNHLIKDCDFHDKKMIEKPMLNNKGRVTCQREVRPVWNNAQRVNHQNKMTHPHPKRNFVPTAVATKSGLVSVNTAKQSSARATTSISTARHVNTDASKPRGNPQYALQDKGIFDSGCSRHITGNKSYLTDYQDIDGGFVAFAGSPKRGKITGKETRDKKNNVLFTETECLVLSPDFKLLDESQNRILVTKPQNKTPYEILLGRPPNISFMRPFGCPVTILNTLDPLGKFDEKADEGFLVVYSINSKDFRVFITRNRKVEENLHINFLENKPNVAGSGPEWLFDIDLLTNSMNYEPVTTGNQTNRNAGIKDNVDAVPTQQYILLPLLYDSPQSSKDAVANDAGKKTNEEPAHEAELDNLLVQQKEGYANNTNRDSIVSPSVSTIEQNFTNADDLPTDPLIPDLEDTGIFRGAYDDEDVGAEADLNNLETTMNVSPIPTTKIHKDHPKDQIIGDINSATQTRRMIKITEEHAMVIQALTNPSWIEAMQEELLNKKYERGIVVRNKAILVAQGYTQEEGIDYDEVFAHVARIEAIRLFLAYASFMGFIVYQMDVKSAFLYGTIKEEVYVYQPPGFEDPQFPDKVYKVEKALYGLHQAPRAWYETLSTYLLENGFRRGTIDKTLFIKKDKGDILLVQVYVDDIIFGSTKKSLCLEFEQIMHKKFQMSSMGELTFFLGLQVMQKDDGILISQDKYVADILKKFDFVTIKAASTPIETNKALNKDEEAEDVDVHLYRSMIRSLMYLTASRPDIMFVVCACARFQVTPKTSHLHAVKRIFRYLKGQPKLGLWYPRDSPFDLEAFSDSDC